MKLVPVPATTEYIEGTSQHWLPFLPMIAARTKETVEALNDRIRSKEVQVILIWDEEIGRAVALIGMRYHKRGDDVIAEWIWMTGHKRKTWEHLLPDLEQYLRDKGCTECRPLCRPGWSRILKRAGYKLTHVQMERSLWDPAAHSSR